MNDPALSDLIQAEIDGELDAHQRAALAARLLADPDARAEREELRQLCAALDSTPQVEPPPVLRQRILSALPLARPGTPVPPARLWSSAPHRWRYAAVIAGALAAGTLVFVTARGPGALADLSGTMAAPRTPLPLDEVRLSGGPVTGRVGLYREGGALSVSLDITANSPVDVLIESGGETRRIEGLGAQPGGTWTSVALPESGASAPVVTLTFLMSGRQVGSATLRPAAGH